MNFDAKFKFYINYFEDRLKNCFNNLSENAPKAIKSAMRYAVEDGGKRIRPVLCFATGELLGIEKEEMEEIALAIEMIHSYSLVHDDLPCMDNDDYRRGKLSTHKKFGEAYGVLAGDALLNFAFEIMLSKKAINIDYIKAVKFIAKCSGYSGMIGGQTLDMSTEKFEKNEKSLYDIIENKTAKLIQAPIVASSLIAKGKFFDNLSDFAYNLGVLFQITDDIMDVEGSLDSLGKTPHKDDKENKLTAVSVFGLNVAKNRAESHYNKAKDCIKNIAGAEFLSEFTDRIYARKN